MVTILLVDDDRMIVELCIQILRIGRDIDVLPASCGKDALTVASRYPNPIHVLLSDIEMPGGMNGIELAHRLTIVRPEIKVVLMSGFAPDNFPIPEEWTFVPKPFIPSTLLSSIGRSLRSSVA